MAIDVRIIEQIKKNDPKVVRLDLSYQSFDSIDFQALAELLAYNNYIHELDISGNVCSQKSIEELGKIKQLTSLLARKCHLNDNMVTLLVQSNRFTSLILTTNPIKSEGIKTLLQSKMLTYLDLTDNQVTDEDAVSLSQHPTLTSLILNRNKIGDKGAIALAQNNKLTLLQISYNVVQTDGIVALAQNKNLESLALAGNIVDLTSAKALGQNQNFSSLDLSYTQINNQQAIELANNNHLNYLNLSYNEIGFEGANALSKSLSLKSLLISYNQLGNGGAIALARHKALTQLDITGNQVGFEGAYALAHNKTLLSLTLSYNSIGDPGAVTLARNKILSELWLSYNEIGDIGAFALANNNTLKKLNLNYNQIGQKGKEALHNNKHFSLIISVDQPPEFTTENLDTIFLLSDSFLCISNLEGVIQFFNPAFPRVLGYRSDELLAHSIFDFLYPADIQETKQLSGKERCSYINHYRCKDGSYRLISWSSKIRGQRLYAIGTDITEKKQSELSLKEAQQENIWIRLHEAEAFGQQQTEFIAQLSHEVRNPLNGAYGLMEMLREQLMSIQSVIEQPQYSDASLMKKELAKITADMQDNIKEMAACFNYQTNILDDNLDIVRIREKKLVLKNVPFDLAKAVNNIINMLKSNAAKKAIQLNVKIPESTLVKGDKLRVQQIIINLLSNAIKFTSAGHIDITLTAQTSTTNSIQTHIYITDTGIGLSTEEIKKLFQQFSQVTGNEYGSSGSGLGLYLIKQIIDLLGGNIVVNSEKGIGSTFDVTLFFEQPSEEESKQLQTMPESAIQAPKVFMEHATVKKQVLIVDDNAINRKILNAYFVKEGYECQFASHGEEALIIYDKQAFDVIIMDIVMPIMNGIVATQEIRKREQEKNLPRSLIIAITANALEHDRIEALNAGVDACIIKPFKKEEIFLNIAKLTQNEKLIPTKNNCPVFFDSPLNNTAQLQSILNMITPGKKWNINLMSSSAWLELDNAQEAEKIMTHFKSNNYSLVTLDSSGITVVVKEISYEKLKIIPPVMFDSKTELNLQSPSFTH